ncbi:MAG: phosphoribosylglycinamide formyltransferase [Gammaproteobacteria bacterium]|nr:phosphoribosylglycinamide formyltransferase [Gammaproteobacteria bacterium]
MKKKLAILISGSGSNLQSFIDAISENSLQAEIALVLSNNADAYGLERAKLAGIKNLVISHTDYESRESFDEALAEEIKKHSIDFIILAGFMRILSPDFINQFKDKILNIHPSLLPKYPGLHTHRRAIENADEYHGTSIHLVNEELDGGPLIAQAHLKLNIQNDEAEVMKAVQKLEHQLYPAVVNLLVQDKIRIKADGIYYDNKKIDKPLLLGKEII